MRDQSILASNLAKCEHTLEVETGAVMADCCVVESFADSFSGEDSVGRREVMYVCAV